jgi:hypothetical protein
MTILRNYQEMRKYSISRLLIVSFALMLAVSCSCSSSDQDIATSPHHDPLPSWNEGSVKEAIISYVEDISNPESIHFIEIHDRIATFDNDGTLWAEQPMYFQLYFAIDRVRTLAPEHPQWKEQEPFKSILNDDMQGVMESGIPGLINIVMETHAGITTDEFEQNTKDWAEGTKHPVLNRPFTDLVYQPMLELLEYLRANDFKTYIVSAGGIDFMRALVTEIYGIPTEQIIGSSIKTIFEYGDGETHIKRVPEIDFINDHGGKPISIQKIIGKKPVFAAGNSDGDLEMLQWTASHTEKSFMLYVHHTDAEREWAYDRESAIGRFDKGLDEAQENDWTIVDMQKDWKVIYPFEMQ